LSLIKKHREPTAVCNCRSYWFVGGLSMCGVTGSSEHYLGFRVDCFKSRLRFPNARRSRGSCCRWGRGNYIDRSSTDEPLLFPFFVEWAVQQRHTQRFFRRKQVDLPWHVRERSIRCGKQLFSEHTHPKTTLKYCT
ncbi:unnamed protein product, partial [Ectocarpus sp. 8 AP-2014]